MSEKRQKTHIIALRLTPDERTRLQAAADYCGVPLSRLVRDAAIARAVEVLRSALAGMGRLSRFRAAPARPPGRRSERPTRH